MEGMGTRKIKIPLAEPFLGEQRITSKNFPLRHLLIQVENSGPRVEKRKTSRVLSSSSRLRNWKVPELYGQFSHRITLYSEQCRDWVTRPEATTGPHKVFCCISVSSKQSLMEVGESGGEQNRQEVFFKHYTSFLVLLSFL